MNRADFFARIRQSCKSEQDYLIALIKARGFLVEIIDGKPCLSDNSCLHDERYMDDARYLNRLLAGSECGSLCGSEIVPSSDLNVAAFEDLFDARPPYGGESWCNGYNWQYFQRREHAWKVDVSCLDSFIARYIKAISACCIFTGGSCDGNHPGRSTMVIDMSVIGSEIWHELICKKYIINRYNIEWNSRCTVVKFTERTKYETYYEVNCAADFLYRNRQKFREIKRKALRDLSPSYFRHHSFEEIKALFSERVNRLFAENPICEEREDVAGRRK